MRYNRPERLATSRSLFLLGFVGDLLSTLHPYDGQFLCVVGTHWIVECWWMGGVYKKNDVSFVEQVPFGEYPFEGQVPRGYQHVNHLIQRDYQ